MSEKNEKTTLITEEQVKKELKISDFRTIKKQQIIDFVSNVHRMPAEVAKACIEQFPNFADFGNTALKQFYKMCDSGIGSVHKESLESYKLILDTIQGQLNNPKLSKKEKSALIDRMIDVGTKIELVGDKKQSFVEGVVKVGVGALGTVITLGAGILGVLMKKKNNG